MLQRNPLSLILKIQEVEGHLTGGRKFNWTRSSSLRSVTSCGCCFISGILEMTHIVLGQSIYSWNKCGLIMLSWVSGLLCFIIKEKIIPDLFYIFMHQVLILCCIKKNNVKTNTIRRGAKDYEFFRYIILFNCECIENFL